MQSCDVWRRVTMCQVMCACWPAGPRRAGVCVRASVSMCGHEARKWREEWCANLSEHRTGSAFERQQASLGVSSIIIIVTIIITMTMCEDV